MPPLIDRNVFFGDPEISGAQLSPDGNWISFRKTLPRRDERLGEGRSMSPSTPRVPSRPTPSARLAGHFWTEDSRYVLFIQDEGGTEDFHIYAVDPAGDPEEESGVPPARDLTPMEGIRAFIYAVPEARPVPDRRRHQRPRSGVARRLPPRHRHRRARTADPERHQRQPVGDPTLLAMFGWPSANAQMAAPTSSWSRTERSAACSTTAVGRRLARPTGSTRTANGCTWLATRAWT